MREFAQALLGRRNADAFQHVERPFFGLFRADPAMLAHRFGNLFADADRRVQRRHRFLEDHRHLVAAQGA